MTKTLYLHVGMPKCASTTIQDVLQTRAGALSALGKFYGKPAWDKTREQGNVAVLLADMREKRTDRVEKALRYFLDRDSDVILSSEMFIGLARTGMSDRLVEQAREKGFEPKLICYLRRQDHWIESDYKQHIKGGSDWTDGIKTLLRNRTKSRVLEYDWLLDNWARSVPREAITVVPLERGQGDHYALERFLGFLDMDPGEAAALAVERRNVSPPVGLIEPMRHLKQALLAQGRSAEAVKEALVHFQAVAPQRVDVPARRFLLSLESRQELLRKYAASNDRLGQRYLGGAVAFDGTLEEEAASEKALNAEATALLAQWITTEPAPEPGPAAAPGPGRTFWQRLRPERGKA